MCAHACVWALIAGHGETVQRIFDILRFLWAIVLAMVDGLTEWLNLLTKQYRDTSTVLCNERYLIIHKIEQVHTYKHLSHTQGIPSNSLALILLPLCVHRRPLQHHSTADSTFDQVCESSDSPDSPTMESCLDEPAAENFPSYR